MLTLDYIKAHPLTPIRVALLKANRAPKPFAEAERDRILNELTQQTSNPAVKGLLATLPQQTLQQRMLVNADLMDEIVGLGWATQLLYLRRENPKASIGKSVLWHSLARADDLAAERTQHAMRIASLVEDNKVRFRWGTPDSWFFYHPAERLINIDLWHGMVFGLYTTRSLIQHEIGHAEITRCFTPAMQKIDAEIKAIAASQKTAGALSPEDYKRKRRLFAEWKYRMNFMNAAEDNAVNRLATQRGLRAPIAYGESLNFVEGLMIEGGIAAGLDAHSRVNNADVKVAQPQLANNALQTAAEAYDRFNALCGATNFAFFCRNRLYQNDAQGWQDVQIDPTRVPLTSEHGENQFERLDRYFDELDSQRQSAVSRLQPIFVSYLQRYLPSNSNMALAQRRATAIDALYQTYAAPLVEQMLDHLDEKLDEQLEAQKNGMPGQMGTSLPGTGNGEDDKEMGVGIPDPTATPQAGAGQEMETGDTVNVNGIGPMLDVPMLPDKPPSQAEPDEEAAAAATSDPDEPDDLTLEEILDQYREAQVASAAATMQDQQAIRQRQQAAKNSSKVDLSSLPPGDYGNYESLTQTLAPYIADMVDQLRAIRDLQREEILRTRLQLEILPEDSDVIGRLDLGAHVNLRVKQVIGEDLDESDFRRFKTDDLEEIVSRPIVVILVDGSGSMNQSSPAGGRLVDQALNSGVIIYEACRELDIPCYLGMWGPSNPKMLARPDDDPVQIGKNINQFRNGLNSATNLAPAFVNLAKHLATLPDTVIFSGHLHAIIMSDGDIQDGEDARKVIDKFFTRVPLSTIDCGILTGKQDSIMERTLHAVKTPESEIDAIAVHHDFTASQLANKIAESLLERLGVSGSLAATRDYEAHRRFRNLGQDLKL